MPSDLLPRIAHISLAEHTRRVAIRSIASRVVLVLAIVGLLSALLHGPRFSAVLKAVMPFTMPGASSATILLISVILLITSRGLRRGIRLAWITALIMLAISAMLHLTKGPIIGGVIDALGAGWLAAQGRCFPVRATLRVTRWTKIFGILLGLVLIGAISTIVFLAVVQNVPVHTFMDVDSWFRRPTNRILGMLFLLALLWTLFSPRHQPRMSPREHVAERERARSIVERWGAGSLDYFALRDDKDWFFVGDSVVAHSVRGGVCLVSPDPIGPPGEKEAAWVEFLDYAGSFGWSVAVIAADSSWLPVYEASGLRSVYLGDEAVVHCPEFTLAGHKNKSLRQAVNRVARMGYSTTFHDPATIDDDIRRQIVEMSEGSRQGEVERGYSMTLSRLFDEHDTGLIMSVTRNEEGRVDAFCQWIPAADIDGWSLDVMRRRMDIEGLPNGILDSNIVATINEILERGLSGLALNFAVMRQVLDGELTGRLDNLTRPVLQRISQNTQMSSLSSFNEKFDPQWRPRYVLLDSMEYVAFQALVMAGAEGVTEIPVIGKLVPGSQQHSDGLLTRLRLSPRRPTPQEAPAVLLAPRATGAAARRRRRWPEDGSGEISGNRTAPIQETGPRPPDGSCATNTVKMAPSKAVQATDTSGITTDKKSE